MRVCPECGTQYEDHVPTCIADGSSLVAERTTAGAPSAPPPALEPARSRGGWVLASAMVVLAATVAVAVTAVAMIAWMRLDGRAEPDPAPVAAQPSPPPAPPAEVPTVDVMLVSDPLGAKVYENDQFVCETPCTVPHPAHAPLPRIFVFKSAGHRDKVVEMTDPSRPISVELSTGRSSPGGVTPNPNPAMPRPSIGRER